MTLSEAIVWSVVRSLLVATLAIWTSSLLVRQIRQVQSPVFRRVGMLLSLAPCFVPELLLGFSWRLAAVRLVHSHLATELLYLLLLLCRCVSVSVAVRLFLVDAGPVRESLFSWQLLKPEPVTWRWRKKWYGLLLFGPWRAAVVAWCLSGLVSFQEFETAALLQIDRYPVSWTVWLFDAHAARQPLTDSLQMVIGPVVFELMLLVPCWLVWNRQPVAAADEDSPVATTGSSRSPRRHMFAVMAWLLVSLGTCVIWPLVSNSVPLVSGLQSLAGSMPLMRRSAEQILVSLCFAAAAAVVALRVSAWLWTRGRTAVTVICLLPGLSGSLLSSLLLLALFQTPVFHPVYDTWLPLLLGLSVAMLPRAFLAVSLLERALDRAALHSADLLVQSPVASVRRASVEIRWRLLSFRWFLAGMVVCHWCFWEVTVASILRPVQLEPVVNRLYNEMHYGRTEALTMMAALAALATPCCGLVVAWLWRILHMRMRRGCGGSA